MQLGTHMVSYRGFTQVDNHVVIYINITATVEFY